MISVTEWVKLPWSERKGRDMPIVLSPNMYRAFERAGEDMSAYAVPEKIPVDPGVSIYITHFGTR